MVKSGLEFFILKSYCCGLPIAKNSAALKGHVGFKNKKFYTIIFKLKSINRTAVYMNILLFFAEMQREPTPAWSMWDRVFLLNPCSPSVILLWVSDQLPIIQDIVFSQTYRLYLVSIFLRRVTFFFFCLGRQYFIFQIFVLFQFRAYFYFDLFILPAGTGNIFREVH